VNIIRLSAVEGGHVSAMRTRAKARDYVLRAASKITVQNFMISVMAERTSLLGIAHRRLRVSKPRRGFRCYEISNNRYATANKNVH